MAQFGVKKLLFVMIVAACLSTFALYRNQTAYFLIAILLPTAIGLFGRYSIGKTNAVSMSSTFASSIIIGGLLMAYGSYYGTFVEPSQGYLVGGGWGSVLASAIFGSIVGSVCGLFAMLFYFIFASIIEFARPTRI
ncbi:hypothetical protein N9X53_04755 [Mariniblastus sp.]|nr:hypothetical protein [Mariniblastus sp.]